MTDFSHTPAGPAGEGIRVPESAGWTPVNVWEYEKHAAMKLDKNAFDYYASGANDMITLRENRAAFTRLRMRPRILRNVEHVNMETTILGDKVSMPILLSPTAMQQMAHADGELATARAAHKAGTLMTLSSWSTLPLEEVAAAAPGGLRWFQLYVYKDREVTLNLIKRAEAAGYKALAVTVDTPVLGRREADVRNKFTLPAHLTMGNFAKTGGDHASGTKASDGGSGLAKYVASLIDKTLNWDDIQWLRKVTTMKIVVKGVMSAEDAEVACQNGVDGILVSNHGARQLDTVPATIEILPEVVKQVAGRCEVYLDGGVSRGLDAFKAIAMGAKAVLIGRAYVWGLVHSGEEGVSNVLGLLHDELEMALRLCGCNCLADVRPEMVTHQSHYYTNHSKL